MGTKHREYLARHDKLRCFMPTSIMREEPGFVTSSLYTQPGERHGPGRPLLILRNIEVFCQETGNILNTTFTSGQNDWHLKKFSTRRILQDDSVTRLVYTSSHGDFWRASSSLSSGPDISPDQPLIYWDFIHRMWHLLAFPTEKSFSKTIFIKNLIKGTVTAGSNHLKCLKYLNI